MKLSSIKLLLASLAVSSLAFAGCAADPTDSGEEEEAEEVGVSADELSSRAKEFVGSYAWRAGDSGPLVDLQQVSLKANGLYSAKVESGLVNPNVQCFAFPCTLPESGTWKVVKFYGQTKIKLNPWGPKPARSYYASVEAQSRTLTLKRYGQTTNLFAEGSTCANVRCNASTHCEMQYGNGAYTPSCVPNAPVSTCASTTCLTGTNCIDTPTGAECVPVLTCAAVLCMVGTTCVEKPTGAECVAPPPPPPPPAPCYVGGCSSQLCSDQPGMISTCEFRPEYACYQTATCKRQPDGQCGWTKTPALTACLANPPKN